MKILKQIEPARLEIWQRRTCLFVILWLHCPFKCFKVLNHVVHCEKIVRQKKKCSSPPQFVRWLKDFYPLQKISKQRVYKSIHHVDKRLLCPAAHLSVEAKYYHKQDSVTNVSFCVSEYTWYVSVRGDLGRAQFENDSG